MRGAEHPQGPRPTPRARSPRQGAGWVFLDWNDPVDGGAVASYRVERREQPDTAWQIVGVAAKSEITLTNQERKMDFEYRIIALNKAGEGPPSNTVAAVV